MPTKAPVRVNKARFLAKLGKASMRSPSATSELTSMKLGEAASKKV
jgi:hypothetical protein